MLNTKDMSAGSGGTKPVIEPGNNVIKINSVSFDQTPYDAEAYNIVLHVETEPIPGEFNGFLKDMENPNGPKYEGQVGRVRFSPYPYKDTTLQSGTEISRDTEVLKAMVFLSEALGKRAELDKIEANTIDQFMVECNKLFSNTGYFNACLGAREWENRDGYINNDLFLPKRSKDGVPIEALNSEANRILKFDANNNNHLRRLIKNEEPKTNSFEPAAVSGDDFDL